jgi:KDO2-lipid IV(A) lauroyltransferase
MPSERKFWTSGLAPLRLFVVWLFYLWMRAIVMLPFSWQLRTAKAMGRWSRGLLAKRRRVVDLNLSACFPTLGEEQRDALAEAHFEALGASIVEMAMGWFGSTAKIRSLVRVEGQKHLEAALGNGRGVILYSAHFTTFEIFFPVLAPLCTRLCGMYKMQRNPAMNKIMTRGRSRNFDYLFDKDSVRDMLRELAANSVVWYATDQSYTLKGSALIPFFGEPAMTNTSITRIARISGATVLPYYCRRLADDSGYVMTIGAPLANFPSDDPEADTRRFTALLENYVLTCPEQYWWVHQRFKGRPAPLPDLYGASP